MATKQKQQDEQQPVYSASGSIATPEVVAEPAKSFEERTSILPPFMDKKGNQVSASQEVAPEDLEPQVVTPTVEVEQVKNKKKGKK